VLGPDATPAPFSVSTSNMAQSGQSSFPLPLPHHQNPIHRSSNSSSGSSSSSHHNSLFSPSPSAPDSFTTTPRITPEPHKQHWLDDLAQSLDGQQEAGAEFELWLQEGEQAAYQQQQGVPSPQPQSQFARFRPYPPELYTQMYAYYPHSTVPLAFPPPYLHPNAYVAVAGQQQGYPNAGIIQRPAPVGSPSSSWEVNKGKRRAADDGPAGSTKRQKNPRIRPDVDPDFVSQFYFVDFLLVHPLTLIYQKFIGEINGQKMYECQLAHCNRMRMQEGSTYHHRTSNAHTQGSKKFLCDMCGR
jgi:hypothetical protein